MRAEDKGPLLVRPPGAVCPMPVGRETDISQVAEACLERVAQEKYTGDDPRFEGMTWLEATVLSLAEDAPHDPDARKEFLDRTMGKPRQKIESTNLNVTLTGFLEQIADAETHPPTDITDEEMFK